MEDLSQLFHPGFVLIFAIVATISSIIPAILTKFVMVAVFGHRVNFALITLTMIITAFLALLALAWLGLLNEDNIDTLPVVPGVMLTFASYAVQLALLMVMVPDQNLDSIAMWKWAVALILQYVLLFVIVLVLALLYNIVVLSAEAQAMV
jgi:hypothetical protein